MSESLTPLEQRVYHYLLDFLAENTYQPSIREIGRRFRIKSTKTVSELLDSLAAKGFIERDHGRSRGVRLVGFSSIGRQQPVPLYDGVSASEPFLREELRSRFVAMDRSFVPSDDAFFLRAPDDELRARGLLAGDLVLVNPSVRARDGELVAVRIDGTYVVRALEHRGGNVALSSGNDLPGIVLGPRDDFSVIGVVAGVFRPFHERREEELD
jgi:repressor LexA